MRTDDSIDERLTRLLAAWRRDVEAEPFAPSLDIAAMRRPRLRQATRHR